MHNNEKASEKDSKKVTFNHEFKVIEVPLNEDFKLSKEKKSYTCEVCYKKFSKKKNIEKHMKRHSPQEINLTLHRLAKKGSLPSGK